MSDKPDTVAKPRKPGWHRMQSGVMVVFLVTAFFGIFGKLDFLGWPFELASHFQMQYATLMLLCSLFFIVTHRQNQLLILIMLVLTGGHLLQIMPDFLPLSKPATPVETPSLKLLNMNVNYANKRYKLAQQLIREETPDIIVVEELQSHWLAGMASVLQKYPYQKYHPHNFDGFGIGVFSRMPLEKAEVRYFGHQAYPSIMVELKIHRQPVTLVAVHPPIPLLSRGYHIRNRLMENLGKHIKTLHTPVIVIGDFNNTPYSEDFKRFGRSTGLQDTRQGFGPQVSWPTFLPMLRIPIDHCLVSPDLKTIQRRIGWNIESDHYPVIIQLKIPTIKRGFHTNEK